MAELQPWPRAGYIECPASPTNAIDPAWRVLHFTCQANTRAVTCIQTRWFKLRQQQQLSGFLRCSVLTKVSKKNVEDL